jgi:hypothetical protein
MRRRYRSVFSRQHREFGEIVGYAANVSVGDSRNCPSGAKILYIRMQRAAVLFLREKSNSGAN